MKQRAGGVSKEEIRRAASRFYRLSFDEDAKARIPPPERRKLRKLMTFLMEPIREEIADDLDLILNGPRPPDFLKWFSLCRCGRGGQCPNFFFRSDLLARRFPFLPKSKPREFFGNHRKKLYQRLAAADNRPSRSEAARARWRLHRERQQGGKPSEVVSHRLWSPGQAPHTSEQFRFSHKKT